MWNYAPLASGLHRLPGLFSGKPPSVLTGKKWHEGSVSKADCSHVFSYRCSVQPLMSYAHPEAFRSWQSFLRGAQSRASIFAFSL